MRISTSGLHAQALATMLAHQSNLAKVQQQLSTGQRLTRAGDDPSAAASGVALDQALAELTRQGEGAKLLENRLSAEESALDSAVDVLQRIKELAVQVNNGGYTDTQRAAISMELKQRYNELVGIANSGDGMGRYLFGGTSDGSPPFSKAAWGVSYNGDQGSRRIEIAPGVDVADGDNGADVFQRIPSGNGTFSVTAAVGNGGTASLRSATVADASTYDGDTYTITFSGGGYTVVGANAGLVSADVYTPGTAITFPGASITIGGTPVDGDSFTVSPSTSQDVFTSVQRLIAAVDLTGTSATVKAQRQNEYLGAQQDLETALAHISVVRSSVGTRLSSIETAAEQREAAKVDVQTALSGLRDTDYAEAVTRMNLLMTALQAAQQTYQKIQGSSLFDYLR